MVPCEALGDTREDPLELAPRRLPLITDKISRRRLKMCAALPNDFPVVLEIGSDISVRGDELDFGGARAAVAPVGVIPISHVSRIHVRSHQDEEFRARRYRNINAEYLPVIVSQALFSGNGPADRSARGCAAFPTLARSSGGLSPNGDPVAGALMLIFASFQISQNLQGRGEIAGERANQCEYRRCALRAIEALTEIGWISSGDDLAVCAAALDVPYADERTCPPSG